jgi:hypothetical protein
MNMKILAAVLFADSAALVDLIGIEPMTTTNWASSRMPHRTEELTANTTFQRLERSLGSAMK